MEDKNRFSILLEHLLEVAEVKNYTLAKRLQYDVSYISKWVSGRMLPAKKTEKRVMEGISACVVDEATDDGRDLLLREYSVSIPSDLKAAIYDNLIAEYDYLQEELDSGEARIGPYTDFWAELNMLQYLTKMAHPVLRRVSQLDIVAVMDLMEMAREYRLKVANLQNGQLVDQRSYDNVYFKLMIDISREKWDPIYDAALIINVLTNFSIFISSCLAAPRLPGTRCLWSRAILPLPACWSATAAALPLPPPRIRRTAKACMITSPSSACGMTSFSAIPACAS